MLCNVERVMACYREYTRCTPVVRHQEITTTLC